MSAENILYRYFEWDLVKEKENIKKHHVSFELASKAFIDPLRIIAIDEKHQDKEERFFCIGRVENNILTVRFVYRNKKIRIFGAAKWRKGVKLYEEKNNKKEKN